MQTPFTYAMAFTGMFLILATSCSKPIVEDDTIAAVTVDDKTLIASAGFNKEWVERTEDGFLIEGDILLTREQLAEMAGDRITNHFVVANEEHYRTFNLVSTPASGSRTITVSLSSGFPSYYSTALNNALARYNSYGLKINFLRVSSGGQINITAANLGTSNGGCILGQSSGFPQSGNPAPGFTLSNSSCATSYINTVNKADEVIAHEIGHTIGFRHTDYVNRASCGGPGEAAGTIGAVFIPGTPTTVSGSYNSWMMACTNGSPTFSAADGVALNYVY